MLFRDCTDILFIDFHLFREGELVPPPPPPGSCFLFLSQNFYLFIFWHFQNYLWWIFYSAILGLLITYLILQSLYVPLNCLVLIVDVLSIPFFFWSSHANAFTWSASIFTASIVLSTYSTVLIYFLLVVLWRSFWLLGEA